MKRLITSLIGAFFFILASALPYSTDDIQQGDTVPAFSVISNQGEVIDTNSLKNTLAVITFFHTKCYDCRKELPLIQEMYDTYGQQIKFICISRGEPEEQVSKYWKEHSLTLPYSAQEDKKVFKLFAEKTIPRVYLIDRSGKINYAFKEKVKKRRLLKAIKHLIQTN